ncbi:MAG: hypothetical protein EON54_26075 [Alcaligenaceae bacterium]|nr:MAG: hypothetical protein EON54_26075 [Alcaligenaceae bacterium]
MQLYQQSGLKDLLVTKGQRYFPHEDFSKLMFEGNDFRLSSIELYDPKREDVYFRLHYRKDAPSWLADTLKEWAGFRNANRTGTVRDRRCELLKSELEKRKDDQWEVAA